jgi:SPP1 gp7 family putative phage head morphogenesis protein
MTAPLRVGIVDFDEAIAAAAARKVVLPTEYYGKLRGVERATAFSVARIAQLDQLDLILKSLVKVLDSGATFDQWRKKIIDAPAALTMPEHRLDNIFRTNVQGAYARGKCVHVANNKATRPYLLYSAINDSRVRPAHLAMNGFVAGVDDPIWATAMPPNGYRCRCTVISLTEKQAEKRRAEDAERMQDRDFAEARLRALINGAADQGWDYSPCSALTMPPGVTKPKPGERPSPALERLAPGVVAAIKRPRHPALEDLSAALLVTFLAMMVDAITERTDRGHDQEA